MSIFTGTTGGDVITPGFVSAGVTSDGGSRPGQGPDLLDGGLGNDTLDGGVGHNVNTLLGGAGNDLLLWNNGGGNDIMDGGAGQDSLRFNGSDTSEIITLSQAGGQLLLQRNISDVTLNVDNVENVEISVGRGTDTIVLNDIGATDVGRVVIALNDETGSRGDKQIDTLIFNGTSGADSFFVSLFDASMTDVGVSGGPDYLVLFTDENDRFVFNAGDGDDTFRGLVGRVHLTVNGDGGNDTLIGTGSGDTLNGGIGADSLEGFEGDDRLNGGDGDDQLGFHAEFGRPLGLDTIEGGTGLDTLSVFVDSGARVEALLGRVGLTTAEGARADTNDVERMVLQMGDAQSTNVLFIGDLTGTEVKEVIADFGLAGIPDDAPDGLTVTGSTGSDQILLSQAGNSILVAGLPATVRVENLSARDFLGVNSGSGHDLVDASRLTSMGLQLEGAAGNDTLIGSAALDVLRGGLGNDSLVGGADNDLLSGEDGADTLSGGLGRDNLGGGLGNDSLVGGEESDQLVGDLGSDTLVGGGGSDVFVYIASQVSGQDQIVDFVAHGANAVHDVLQLLQFSDRSFAALVANGHIFDTAAGVAITDGDHVFATLLGIKFEWLDASDFLFTGP
jgi:Ca2+-binding RTX toxin-like protein